MSQQFCLRWNNHQPNFISVFTTLLNTESLVDVTLAAEGKHLQAHKVVLSACSVYFQTLFTANPSRHPIVILKDVKYSDLRIMVDFMYYGEVNVSQEQLPQILETAKMLKIKGLTEMPDSASLTKAQSSSSDRPDLGTPGESSWEGQQRHSMSPSNMSPTAKKRRPRKTSTGSGSASNERPSDDRIYDQGGSSLNLVKTVPDNPGMIMCNTNTQIRPRQQFEQYSQETNTIDNIQQQSEDSTNCLMRPVGVDSMEEAAAAIQHQGGQWTLLDHSAYSRYATQTCVEGSSPLTHHSVDQMTTAFPYNIHNPSFNDEVAEFQQQMIRTATPTTSTSSSNNQLMQMNDQQPKRRRTSNPQANENFQRALEAVRIGGIGFCKAARMYGVNNRTLWLEYKKKGYPNIRPSIKNRIKREANSPPPERKDEMIENNGNLLTTAAAALYSPATTVLGLMDARYLHEHNLHPINFNAVQ